MCSSLTANAHGITKLPNCSHTEILKKSFTKKLNGILMAIYLFSSSMCLVIFEGSYILSLTFKYLLLKHYTCAFRTVLPENKIDNNEMFWGQWRRLCFLKYVKKQFICKKTRGFMLYTCRVCSKLYKGKGIWFLIKTQN